MCIRDRMMGECQSNIEFNECGVSPNSMLERDLYRLRESMRLSSTRLSMESNYFTPRGAQESELLDFFLGQDLLRMSFSETPRQQAAPTAPVSSVTLEVETLRTSRSGTSTVTPDESITHTSITAMKVDGAFRRHSIRENSPPVIPTSTLNEAAISRMSLLTEEIKQHSIRESIERGSLRDSSAGRTSLVQEPRAYTAEEQLLNECALNLRKQAELDADCGTRMAAGWTHRETDKKTSTVVGQKSSYGGSATAFCLSTDIPGVTPQQLQDFMTDPRMEVRKQWDLNCATADVLQKAAIPEGWGTYWYFHNSQHPYLGGLIDSRDFLTVNIKYDNDGTFWMVTRTVPSHPLAQVNPKLVRAEIHTLFFRFEPLGMGEATRVTYALCLDLKMSRLLRSPIESGMVKEGMRLFEVFRKMGRKKPL
eukprot:TRINITY_DN4446_c0_g1_i1.p1 TRINITY_DN4446_c0_g1~~TRINITY_DN4446_c0_g1_i1.p1  ORF type:complete len:422 (+),score=68.15 TRINITY_DN4446_c0_g1_i1:82-1347(+)